MAGTEPESEQTDARRQFKVLKLRILKPVNMEWGEFGAMLREVQYRVWRLANYSLTERYKALSEKENKQALLTIVQEQTDIEESIRTQLCKKIEALAGSKISALSKLLAEKIRQERSHKKPAASKAGRPLEEIPDSRLCQNSDGLLMSYITDALDQKLGAELKGDKWKQILKGERSLPTYKRSIPIPLRGGVDKFTPLARETINGKEEVVFEPRICVQPYPKIIVTIPEKDKGGQAVLKRLLDNNEQEIGGYRQRSFEIKQDKWDKKWWLLVAYDMPPAHDQELNPDRIVGVDVGFSCPLYAAVSDGWQRLGHQEFGALGAEIRRLRLRTIAQRRAIQRGGRRGIEDPGHKPARSGHGVARKLLPTERLQDRVDNAQTTLNHRMSAAVIKFALDHKAGVIQMENLSGLDDVLRGTFLGAHWRYFQLQSFIEYKARAAGIDFRKVNPRYSSRRCSQCGKIWHDFSREYRDEEKRKTGKDAKFKCSDEKCPVNQKPLHADYNAAKNLAVKDIEKVIRDQCKQQGIEYTDVGQDSLTTAG